MRSEFMKLGLTIDPMSIECRLKSSSSSMNGFVCFRSDCGSLTGNSCGNEILRVETVKQDSAIQKNLQRCVRSGRRGSAPKTKTGSPFGNPAVLYNGKISSDVSRTETDDERIRDFPPRPYDRFGFYEC